MLEKNELKLQGMLQAVRDIIRRDGLGAGLFQRPDRLAVGLYQAERSLVVLFSQPKIGVIEAVPGSHEENPARTGGADGPVGTCIHFSPDLQVDVGDHQSPEPVTRLAGPIGPCAPQDGIQERPQVFRPRRIRDAGMRGRPDLQLQIIGQGFLFFGAIAGALEEIGGIEVQDDPADLLGIHKHPAFVPNHFKLDIADRPLPVDQPDDPQGISLQNDGIADKTQKIAHQERLLALVGRGDDLEILSNPRDGFFSFHSGGCPDRTTFFPGKKQMTGRRKDSLDSVDSRELKGGWGVERGILALSPFFTTSASPWMRVNSSPRGCDDLIFSWTFPADNPPRRWFGR